MKLIHSFALLSTALLSGACTDSEREAFGSPAPEGGSTDVVLRKQDARDDLSAYVFRLGEGNYRLDRVLADGWSAQGTLHTSLPDGSYRFLFCEGSGSAMQPFPQPLDGIAWEEMAFERKVDPSAPDRRLPAGELYLQAPADAERVYRLGGMRTTVSATLTRAVCEVVLYLKRGYPDAQGVFHEVPYTAPRTVLEQIDGVELTVTGSALRAGVGGGSGEADVRTQFSVAQAKFSPDGFARMDGPMLIPPAEGENVGLHLVVDPADNAPIAPATLDLSGVCERNKRLEITLWITSAYPTVAVEVDLAPISDERPGDAGVWE